VAANYRLQAGILPIGPKAASPFRPREARRPPSPSSRSNSTIYAGRRAHLPLRPRLRTGSHCVVASPQRCAFRAVSWDARHGLACSAALRMRSTAEDGSSTGVKEMRMHKLLVAAALLPLGAVAQDLDYTFVELSYMDTDLDAGPIDVGGDGFGLEGSLSVTDSVFLFANYETQDYGFGVDASSYDLGAGMRWALKPQLDL